MARYEDEGIYELEVIGHAFVETKKGDPMIEFDCKVCRKIRGFGTVDEEFVPAETSQYNVTIRVVFSTEGQREFNVRKLRFAGWQGKSFEDFDMVGLRVIAACTHSSHNGKTHDNFDFIMPPREQKESKPGLKRKLNALLSKELRETMPQASRTVRDDSPQAAPAPQVDESSPSAGGGDETPF